MKKILSLIYIVFLIPFYLFSENEPMSTKKPDFDKLPKYEDLLERVKSGDTTVDFFEFRMAYTRTEQYFPYTDNDSVSKMFEAYKEKDYNSALGYALSVLELNYTDLDAHFICESVYDSLGNIEKRLHHTYVLNGLLASILSSGDGATPEAAYMVISTKEEYFLLYSSQLEAAGQILESAGADPVDHIMAYDSKAEKTLDFYFNISIPLKWLNMQLGQKEKAEGD